MSVPAIGSAEIRVHNTYYINKVIPSLAVASQLSVDDDAASGGQPPTRGLHST